MRCQPTLLTNSYGLIGVLMVTVFTLVQAIITLVQHVSFQVFTPHYMTWCNRLLIPIQHHLAVFLAIRARNFHIATSILRFKMLFQSPQFPHPLTPLLVVSAANTELVYVTTSLFIQNVHHVILLTVRTFLLSPGAEPLLENENINIS